MGQLCAVACGPDPPEHPSSKNLDMLLEDYKTLETFDIILFSSVDRDANGTPSAATRREMRIMGSNWTHVAMVYRNNEKENNQFDKKLGSACKEKVLILEALGGGGLPWSTRYQADDTGGIDLVNFVDRMKLQLGQKTVDAGIPHPLVAVRRLLNERTPEMLEKLEQKYLEVNEEKYNYEYMNHAAVDMCGEVCGCAESATSDKTGKFICSALVAYMYQRCGLLPMRDMDYGTRSAEFLPINWAEEDMYGCAKGICSCTTQPVLPGLSFGEQVYYGL